MNAGPWLVVVAIFVIVAEITAVEVYALVTGKAWTISKTMAVIAQRWVLFPWLCGLIIGALTTHFFGGSWNCGGGMGPG